MDCCVDSTGVCTKEPLLWESRALGGRQAQSMSKIGDKYFEKGESSFTEHGVPLPVLNPFWERVCLSKGGINEITLH